MSQSNIAAPGGASAATQHYHLSQWAAADRLLREDFNRDNQNVDSALAALASVASAAAAAPRAQIAVGSYIGTGAAGASTPNTLNFSFEPKLLFVMKAGSAPTALPTQTVIISDEDTHRIRGWFFIVRGITDLACSETSSRHGWYRYNHFTWSSNSVSWYGCCNNDGGVPEAATQFNTSGATFYYCALG